MANAHVRSRPIIESLGILTGAGGADYVAGGATINAHTYVAITVISGTTTDLDSSAATGGDYAQGTVSATSVDTDIWDTLSTVEVPEGTTIYGKWSSVVVTDGDKALVYRESSTD